MDQSVYGVYDSTQEAMDAVQKLKERGFGDHVFTLIARDEDELSFTNDDQSLEVNVITTHNEEEDSFLDKAIRFFMDVEKRLDDHLIGTGLSEARAKKYADEIESGRIVVLVEEKK